MIKFTAPVRIIVVN